LSVCSVIERVLIVLTHYFDIIIHFTVTGVAEIVVQDRHIICHLILNNVIAYYKLTLQLYWLDEQLVS